LSPFCGFLPVVKKEFLMLVRDPAGLAILFILPVLLLFVVTIAQINVLKNQLHLSEVLLIDESGSSFAGNLQRDLNNSGFFICISGNDEMNIDSIISSGIYPFGVVVPEGDSGIIILTEPSLQAQFKNPAVNALKFIIRGAQAKTAMDGLLLTLPEQPAMMIRASIQKSLASGKNIREATAGRNGEALNNIAVQSILPGIIVFALFFLVIPVSGSIIAEKSAGTFIRLKSFPNGIHPFMAGKTLVFLVVGSLQVFLMLFLAWCLFPVLFDLSPPEISKVLPIMILTIITSVLSAVGFGMIAGSFATSHGQAAMLGSVIVVMLGVISGTFFPVQWLPYPVSALSYLSPLRWGTDNYLEILIRHKTSWSILQNTFAQLLFFGLAITVSIVKFARFKQE
jgi:ABC-2 type transport system permease protein